MWSCEVSGAVALTFGEKGFVPSREWASNEFKMNQINCTSWIKPYISEEARRYYPFFEYYYTLPKRF